MRKLWIGFAAVLFSLVMFSGISWSQSVTLKYGTPEPPQAWAQVNVVLPFLDRVEKDSGGTVKFEKFMGGTIGRDVTKYTQHIKDGVINLAWIFNVYQPGRFPDDAVFNVPFTANDPFEATMAMNNMVEAGLLRGYDEFIPLALFGLNQFTIHATFPVKKPTDLKGRKLRVAGKMQQALYEALGGTPVGIAINESAEAISKGVVEGIITEWNGLNTWKLVDLTKYHCMVPFGSIVISILMNKDVYKSLPPKAREAIEKHRGQMARDWGEKQTQNESQIMQRVMEDPKHQVYIPKGDEMEPWKKIMWPVADAWAKEHPNGPKLVEIYQKEVAKMRGR